MRLKVKAYIAASSKVLAEYTSKQGYPIRLVKCYNGEYFMVSRGPKDNVGFNTYPDLKEAQKVYDELVKMDKASS